MRGKLFAIALGAILVLFFSGCGGPRVLDRPAKRAILHPAKQPPAKAPATQRPYVISGKTYYPLPSAEGFEETGLASWYGKDFHGKKTSNGEIYDMYGGTAAHKILPMNTHVLVRNLENGREIVVRINDRGPFVKGRVIDLSHTGAQELDMIKNGTARVRLTALGETVTTGAPGRQIERFLPHRDFSQGEFFIQVGSFIEPENARRLQDQIRAWGKEAAILPHDLSGRRYYRVQIQAGRDLREAKRQERALTEGGFPDAFVIAR